MLAAVKMDIEYFICINMNYFLKDCFGDLVPIVVGSFVNFMARYPTSSLSVFI